MFKKYFFWMFLCLFFNSLSNSFYATAGNPSSLCALFFAKKNPVLPGEVGDIKDLWETLYEHVVLFPDDLGYGLSTALYDSSSSLPQQEGAVRVGTLARFVEHSVEFPDTSNYVVYRVVGVSDINRFIWFLGAEIRTLKLKQETAESQSGWFQSPIEKSRADFDAWVEFERIVQNRLVRFLVDSDVWKHQDSYFNLFGFSTSRNGIDGFFGNHPAIPAFQEFLLKLGHSAVHVDFLYSETDAIPELFIVIRKNTLPKKRSFGEWIEDWLVRFG